MQNGGGNFGNIISLSPSKIEDKSKSTTNKAYMIGSSN
jgi:hypothetical protein